MYHKHSSLQNNGLKSTVTEQTIDKVLDLINKCIIAIKSKIDEQLIPCNSVLRQYEQIEDLKRDLEKGEMEFNDLEKRFRKYSNILNECKSILSRIYKTTIILLVITITILALLILAIALPIFPLKYMFLEKYLPYLVAVFAIAIVSEIFSYLVSSTRIKNRYHYNDLVSIVEELGKARSDLSNKINSLNILLKTYSERFSFREYYLCKCLSELRELKRNINKIKSIISKIHDKYNETGRLKGLIKVLRNRLRKVDGLSICESFYTKEECYVKIDVSKELYTLIDHVESYILGRDTSLDKNLVEKAIVKIRIRDQIFTLDIGLVLASILDTI